MTDEVIGPTIERAAEHLGVPEETLRRHLRKYAIDRKSMTLEEITRAYIRALTAAAGGSIYP